MRAGQATYQHALSDALLLLLFALVWLPAHAATQVGSAPYRASATGAGNSHSPVFSADGRHVAFISHANNLVTNDDLGPHLDLFVRDLAASNTVLVSVSTNGFGGANDNIGLYSLSSNAQVIAFDTRANNLTPGDNNRVSDIYVRNLAFGMTRLVSVNAGDTGSANGPSSNPLLSEDGRYVIFESLASNLVTNDFNGTNDIFIHDLTTGLTELVSVNADGTASPNGPSHSPSISADGLTVAFVSHATNLVEGVTNKLGEVYARNVTAGTTRWAMASHIEETHARVSSPLPDPFQLSPYVASEPVLNGDGRFVLFKTLGSAVRFDLHLPTNSIIEWLRYTNNSTFPPSYWSVLYQFHDNPRLAGDVGKNPVSLSKDGRYAAFDTATNYVPYPGNEMPPRGIRVVDFGLSVTNYECRGCCLPIRCPNDSAYTLASQEAFSSTVLTNVALNAGRETWTRLPWLRIDSTGSRMFFTSDATNLVSGITNRTVRLYHLELSSRAIRLLNTNLSGNSVPDLGDVQPSMSPDASLIAWDSPDDNIVPDDLNRAWDVFVRNVDTGETQLISARHPDLPAASGIALSRLDLNPGAISANGQRLGMLSLDSTLAPDDTNHWRDLFVHDFLIGTNIDVSRSIGRVPFSTQTNFPGTNPAAMPFFSSDGRFIAFGGEVIQQSGFVTNRAIYWRDLQTSSNRLITAGTAVSYPILSADGRFVAFHTADRLDPFTDVGSLSDIYIYIANFTPAHHVWRNPLVVSAPRVGYSPTGNGPSANPVFSPDSTWVIFQSQATDLTSDSDTTPGRYQLFARQFLTDQTNLAGGELRLISYTTTASTGPNGISTDLPLPGGGANPRFSADARYVAFESSPNLIYRHDLLGSWVTNIMAHPDPWFPSFTNRARFTNDLVCSNCFNPTLNADGRYIAYETLSAPGTIRGIVVKDLQSGHEELNSVSMTGTNGNGPSSTPLISHDARFVVFASRASDLVRGDNNRAMDIFVRDRPNGVTHCLSRNFAATGTGNRVSSNPIMAADGRTVAFQSFASDLVPGDYNYTRDVFVVTLGGPDNDGDHMDDDWEMAYFSTLSRNGAGDFDNDGSSDLAEFWAGTNPANDTSILRVLTLATSLAAGPNPHRNTVLLWSAIPGKTYRVQFKADLNGPWTTLGADITASSTSASATDTIEAPDEPINPHRFYRVLLAQ